MVVLANDVTSHPPGSHRQLRSTHSLTYNCILTAVYRTTHPDHEDFLSALYRMLAAMVARRTLSMMTDGVAVVVLLVMCVSLAGRVDAALPNNNPSFDRGPDVVQMENAGQTTVPWGSNIKDNDGNSQSLKFIVDAANKNLFEEGPMINDKGVLSFTPKKDQFGTTLVDVDLEDGGAADCPDQTNCTCNPQKCNRAARRTFTIEIRFKNLCPYFTANGDITVDEVHGTEYGFKTFTNWINMLNYGGNNIRENGQKVKWVVENDNPALFNQPPRIDFNTKDLKFELKADFWGVAHVSVYAIDDGGVDNGGCDRSAKYDFVINVKFINRNPFFTFGENPIYVKEDSGITDKATWATGISQGALNEDTQRVNFNTRWVNSACADLFIRQPEISPGGHLSWELYPDKNTFNLQCDLQVQIEDDYPPGHGFSCAFPSCPTLRIVVEPVNDKPSFVTSGTAIEVWEDLRNLSPVPVPAKASYPNWAIQITPGNKWEIDKEGQDVYFTVACPQTNLFDEMPTVSKSGTLSFTLKKNQNGQVQCAVTIFDTLNLQGNTQDLTINVLSVNDPPQYLANPPSPLMLQQDCGDQTLTSFLSNVLAGPSTALDEIQRQSVSYFYQTTANPPNLFSVQPTVLASGPNSGKLAFKCGAGTSGDANITVTIVDTGGTERTGVDRVQLTYRVIISPAVVSPSFTMVNDRVVVVESQCDASPGCSFADYLTDIRTGLSDNSGTVAFALSATDTSLFATQPAINAQGVLTFKTQPNLFGSTFVSISTTSSTGKTTPSRTFQIIINAKNNAPSFVKSFDVTGTKAVDECRSQSSGCPKTFAGWATNILKGAPGSTNEEGQTLQFICVIPADRAGLFTAGGVNIDPSTGTLSFTLVNNGGNTKATGPVVVSITLKDSGGTQYGGKDTAQGFVSIEILPFTEPPTFTLKSPSVYQDSGSSTIAGFISGLTPGSSSATPLSSALTLSVSAVTASKFSSLPTAAFESENSASLSFALAPGEGAGTTGLTVTVRNTETGLQTTRSAVLTIVGYNKAPTFTVTTSTVSVEKGSGLTTRTVLSSISAGSASETATQHVTFTVTCEPAALFQTSPTMSALGALSFVPDPGRIGTAFCNVVAKDDGGSFTQPIPGLTPPVSIDTSAPQPLSISVTPIPSAPSFSLALTSLEVASAQGNVRVPAWATVLDTGDANVGKNSTALMYDVTCTATAGTTGGGASLFDVPPAVAAGTGDLVFGLVTSVSGPVSCSISFKNTQQPAGSVFFASAAKTFTISARAVDTPPTFSASTTSVFVSAATASVVRTVTGWASALLNGLRATPVGNAIISFDVTDVAATSAMASQLLSTGVSVSLATREMTVPLRANSGGPSSGGSFSVDACFTVKGGSYFAGVSSVNGWQPKFTTTSSVCKRVTISVTAPNGPPIVVLGSSSFSVLENGGSTEAKSLPTVVTISQLATRVVPGDAATRAGSPSVSSAALTCSACNRIGDATKVLAPAALFSGRGVARSATDVLSGSPIFSVDGELTLAPNMNGECTGCRLRVTDNAGMTGDSEAFSVTIGAVNQAPSYTIKEGAVGSKVQLGSDGSYTVVVAAKQGATVTVPAVFGSVSPGVNEEAQTVSFLLTPSAIGGTQSPACAFADSPVVDGLVGTLTFRVNSALPLDCPVRWTYSVVAADSGGTANGGKDSTTAVGTSIQSQQRTVKLQIDITRVWELPVAQLSSLDVRLDDRASLQQSIAGFVTLVDKSASSNSATLTSLPLVQATVGCGPAAAAAFIIPALVTSTGSLEFTLTPGFLGLVPCNVTVRATQIPSDVFVARTESDPYVFSIRVYKSALAPAFTWVDGSTQFALQLPARDPVASDLASPSSVVVAPTASLSSPLAIRVATVISVGRATIQKGDRVEENPPVDFVILSQTPSTFIQEMVINATTGMLTRFIPVAGVNGSGFAANIILRRRPLLGEDASSLLNVSSATLTLFVSLRVANRAPTFDASSLTASIVVPQAPNASLVLAFDDALGTFAVVDRFASPADALSVINVALATTGGSTPAAPSAGAASSSSESVRPVIVIPALLRHLSAVEEDQVIANVSVTCATDRPLTLAQLFATAPRLLKRRASLTSGEATDETIADLYFILSGSAAGIASCKAIVRDSGGVTFGGNDTTVATFRIVAAAPIVVPSFALANRYVDVSVGGSASRDGFALSVSTTVVRFDLTPVSAAPSSLLSVNADGKLQVSPRFLISGPALGRGGALQLQAGSLLGAVNFSVVAVADPATGVANSASQFFLLTVTAPVTSPPIGVTTTLAPIASQRRMVGRIVLEGQVDTFSATEFKTVIANYATKLLATRPTVFASLGFSSTAGMRVQPSDVSILAVAAGSVVVDYAFEKVFVSDSTAASSSSSSQSGMSPTVAARNAQLNDELVNAFAQSVQTQDAATSGIQQDMPIASSTTAAASTSTGANGSPTAGGTTPGGSSSSSTAAPPSRLVPSLENWQLYLIIAAGALVLVILIVLLVCVLRRKRSDDPNATDDAARKTAGEPTATQKGKKVAAGFEEGDEPSVVVKPHAAATRRPSACRQLQPHRVAPPQIRHVYDDDSDLYVSDDGFANDPRYSPRGGGGGIMTPQPSRRDAYPTRYTEADGPEWLDIGGDGHDVDDQPIQPPQRQYFSDATRRAPAGPVRVRRLDPQVVARQRPRSPVRRSVGRDGAPDGFNPIEDEFRY